MPWPNTRDVWFALTPTCGGSTIIDTSGSAFDTILSVHSDCPGTDQNTIACNDDFESGSYDSQVTFSATAGVTYLVRVSGFAEGHHGAFQLNIFEAVPENDVCADAIVAIEGTQVGCTNNATADVASAPCGPLQPSPDVWYAYTAPCSGPVDINTNESNFDTLLSVHSACPSDPQAIILACDDDSAEGNNSALTFIAQAGSTYFIRVGGFINETGSYLLNIAGPCDSCPADIAPAGNEDGLVNVADLLALVAAWGPCGPGGPCVADIAPLGSPDGTVNVGDLLEVISAWGACP
ncbi:MAG: hypothetical protein L0219_05175 [Phycisphaerales bacterium]|nr:hypothetical protein [Phycisphaerales bacterium]